MYYKFIIRVILFFCCFTSASAEVITDPVEHYAKQLYKESSISQVIVDLDNNGLQDIIFQNMEEGGSNGRGLYYCSLYLNSGDGYVVAKGDGIAVTGYEFYFMDDLGVPGLFTYIPAGGKEHTKVVYYINEIGSVVMKKIAKEYHHIVDEVRIAPINKVLLGKNLPFSKISDTPVKTLINPEVYSQLPSRDDNPWEKYFFRDDPERPGLDWQIAMEKKTYKPVGYFNVMTNEFVPIANEDAVKLMQIKIKQDVPDPDASKLNVKDNNETTKK